MKVILKNLRDWGGEGSQGFSEVLKGSHRFPKVPKSSQRFPKVPKNYDEAEGKGCEEMIA